MNTEKVLPPWWFSCLEIGTIGLLTPWFLVPSLGFRVWLMIIPLLFWGFRLLICGRATSRTPLAIPILGMSTMLGISMLVTFDPLLSLPKVAGVYYGIVVYFVIVNNLSWNLIKRLVLPTLLLSGFFIAGLSLFGMRWSGAKLPLIGTQLQNVGKSIPRLLNGIPRAEKGISTNQLGGTLILLIPMQAAFFVFSVQALRGKALDWLRILGSGTVLCLNLFVLLLTQSRGAIAAALVVLSALSLYYLRHKRGLTVTLITLSLIIGGFLIFGAPVTAPYAEMELEELSDSLEFKLRPETWSRAYRILHDHPYTGIGFETFSKVLTARYIPFKRTLESSQVIPHAHNLYLQTALDLGIPGLIAFLALHSIVGWMLFKTVRYANSPLVRVTAIGILLGLSAQLLYGWIDCIALGQKPSIFFWVYLALSTIVFKNEFEDQHK